MRLPACALVVLVFGCVRVSAEIGASPVEPETSPPTPEQHASAPVPSTNAWYGDLQLTPRIVAEQAPPAPERSRDKPEPRERPTGELPGPTSEELAAWDRKDPEAEAPLFEWDRAHVTEMSSHWRELQCLRLAVVSVGNASYNSNDAAGWQAFMAVLSPIAERWIEGVLGPEADILFHSKSIGLMLEAHEIISRDYPDAFEASDTSRLNLLDARWMVVAQKLDDRFARMSTTPVAIDPENVEDLATCRSWLATLG